MIAVIGAGMAGLLAANMLRSEDVTIVEAQNELPNNHHALLRFRSEAVSNALGIPFKKVNVIKGVHKEGYSSNVAAILAYGKKVASSSGLRSIVSSINGEICERYIAPPDLVQRMAKNVDVIYGERYKHVAEHPVISTMPMFELARSLEYDGFKKAEFNATHPKVLTAELDGVDVYASLYVPQPELPFYRVSITGSKLIIETNSTLGFNSNEIIREALVILGIHGTSYFNTREKIQRYGKILPIDEGERKRFIIWASEKHNVYSLGRFATWRPGLLMDDVVNDVRIIQKLIDGESSYEMRKS